MVSISVLRVDGSATTVSIEITGIADPESLGIQQVDVFDNEHVALYSREGNCDRYVYFKVLDVDRTHLPVFVVATECPASGGNIPGESTVVGPLLNEERTDPSATVRCLSTAADMPNENNAACMEKNVQAQRQRNEISRLCSEASELRRHRDESAAVAAVLFVAAVGFTAAAIAAYAVPFGITSWLGAALTVIAALTFAAAIAASIAALVYSVWLGDKMGEVARAQAEYNDLFAQIQRVCCPEFITVSADAPGCE